MGFSINVLPSVFSDFSTLSTYVKYDFLFIKDPYKYFNQIEISLMARLTNGAPIIPTPISSTITFYASISDLVLELHSSTVLHLLHMMASSYGNIFRVTGHFGGEFPAQRPVTRSFDVFFDLRPNKRLSKQSWGWWFETPSRSLWPHCNARSCFQDNLNSFSLF